ncbi:hypothetical protein GCM10010156_74280 [Planobispora rosea]|uniref:Uncharacterized protein n=2 Tax=Planobispora rosea TaxID=35762 RepID=A0A8J3S626_PLARO|nr:hypothetical protein GCM10010156_74280 [Planobispora rosea]GIH88976.1 hypothetical protein Pro02_73840 [Planobispora rosea]
MFAAMVIVYAIPIVVVVVSLFVTSRSFRRKILYLSTSLVAMATVPVVAWAIVPRDWGFWLFFVFPAALITGIRLIVAVALGPTETAQ